MQRMMGRYAKPQKSKKNKKIKAIDPFYVGNRSADRDAEKYNMAPKEIPLEKEFSHSVREIERLKNVAKMKRKQRISNMEREGMQDWQHGMLRPEPFVPEFKKRRRETEEAFMNRVDCETQAVIHRSQFEDKYQLNEYDPVDKAARNPKRRKVDANPEGNAKKKRRLMEKREKLLLKKLRKMEDRIDKELEDPVLHDNSEKVRKPKSAAIKWTPGQRSSSRNQDPSQQSLLQKQQKKKTVQPIAREIGKTIKSKFLSPAAREALESEREKAINLYRRKKKGLKFSAILNRQKMDS